MYVFNHAHVKTGDSQATAARISALFEIMREEKKTCVLLLDEVDDLLFAQAKVRCELFKQEWRRFEAGYIVIATTNKPWKVAEAVLQRCEYKIYVDVPDFKLARSVIVQQLRASHNDISISGADLAKVASRVAAEKRSNANLIRVVWTAIERSVTSSPDLDDFMAALDEHKTDYDTKIGSQLHEYNNKHGWQGSM